MLFVTPEYNRSIPGALKNAIDWASRPWGQNSFDHIPAAVIGASIGQIGTAMGQQSLRGVLSFCNARQMTSPEAYIQYSPEVFLDDGEVTNDSTREFLTRVHGRVPHLHRHGLDRPATRAGAKRRRLIQAVSVAGAIAAEPRSPVEQNRHLRSRSPPATSRLRGISSTGGSRKCEHSGAQCR